MNLKNMNEFAEEVENKINKINQISKHLNISNGMTSIRVTEYDDFRIAKGNILDVNCSSVKAFKILLIKELEQMLVQEEKELKELINKGIEDNE